MSLIEQADKLNGQPLDPKAGVYKAKDYGYFVVIRKKYEVIAVRARNGKFYPNEQHFVVFVDAQLNVYPSGDWRTSDPVQFRRAEQVWPHAYEQEEYYVNLRIR